MALEVKSIDEELTRLADIYDDLIKPRKLVRSNDNKLYLLLRGIAAGNVGLNDAAVVLRDRFNPRYCDDSDLYFAAEMVGTDFIQGKGSLLDIFITNSGEETKILPAGRYKYQSPSGEIFSFSIDDMVFDPLESGLVIAISDEKGAFHVGRMSIIKPVREDNVSIDEDITFSCEDNSNQLGYADESPIDFRTRILNDTERKDAIKRLELAIKNLSTILECTLVFNDSVNAQEYDGITLAGKRLLIIVTGAPTNELARLVSEQVAYDTQQVNPDDVVWHENSLYINGKRPVYYTKHAHCDFSLRVEYQYVANRVRSVQVEAAIAALFRPYMNARRYIDMFSEKDAYKVVSGLTLPSVSILNIDIVNSEGETVSFICIPRTKLPNLTNIVFTARDKDGVQ